MANSITNPTGTYTPTEFFANDAEIRTTTRTGKAGNIFTRGQAVMSDAAGKIVPHDGSAAPLMVIVNGVDASGGDTYVQVYVSAAIFMDKITWPAAANTSDLKQKLCEGSGITVYESTGGY